MPSTRNKFSEFFNAYNLLSEINVTYLTGYSSFRGVFIDE